jgi:uncharacterized protein
MLAFFFDPYFFITIPGILLAMWAQMKLSANYNRYSQVGSARGLTGADAARHILDRNGLRDVPIEVTPGHLTDHYDPGKRAVFLSEENYRSTSLAAVGVAAHEVGHAIQHQTAYGPLGLRMALVGVTGFASKASWFAIIGGMLLANFSNSGLGRSLMLLGVGLFSVMVFFQFITLPVEYDASRRAKDQLAKLGLILPQESEAVNRVLGAAALTYVAGLVTSALELLRLLLIVRGMGGRDER